MNQTRREFIKSNAIAATAAAAGLALPGVVKQGAQRPCGRVRHRGVGGLGMGGHAGQRPAQGQGGTAPPWTEKEGLHPMCSLWHEARVQTSARLHARGAAACTTGDSWGCPAPPCRCGTGVHTGPQGRKPHSVRPLPRDPARARPDQAAGRQLGRSGRGFSGAGSWAATCGSGCPDSARGADASQGANSTVPLPWQVWQSRSAAARLMPACVLAPLASSVDAWPSCSCAWWPKCAAAGACSCAQ